MKQIFTIFTLAALALVSCSKFEPGKTATEDLAGTWVCTVYVADGEAWSASAPAQFMTYNSAANTSVELWLDDQESYWGTKVKLDVSNGTFGKDGKEYLDNYNGVAQMIWGGKITEGAAVAPGSGTKCDKIEFYIAFSNDSEDGVNVSPYAYAYYVVGYRRTGFPEDDGNPILDWELPAVVEVPDVTDPLPTEGEEDAE